MKKLKLVSLLAVLALIFAACGEEEEEEEFPLVGNWNIDKQIIRTTEPGGRVSEFVEINIGTFLFRADGTGLLTQFESNETFGWSISDNLLSLTFEVVTYVFTFSIIDNNHVVIEFSITPEGNRLDVIYHLRRI